MSRLVTLCVTLVLVVILGSSGAAAAGPNDIERAVFIHYRAAPASEHSAARAPKTQACPDPTTCTDNRWQGHKWPGGSVSYQLTAPASIAKADAAVTAAFAAWTRPVAAGGLTVTPQSGTMSCSTAGTTTNEVNQICWRDLTASYPNAIAVTFMWAYRSNKQIVEADVVFNSGSGFEWSYTDPGTCGTYGSCNTATGSAGTYDIRNIATHEFGHFLAWFADLYNGRDSEMTMYGYGSTAELKKDSLAKGDCLGITSAYGGSCP